MSGTGTCDRSGHTTEKALSQQFTVVNGWHEQALYAMRTSLLHTRHGETHHDAVVRIGVTQMIKKLIDSDTQDLDGMTLSLAVPQHVLRHRVTVKDKLEMLTRLNSILHDSQELANRQRNLQPAR